MIKRFYQQEAAPDCALCRDTGWTGEQCPGHHYAVLPGGHVEAGETIPQAAERELREETTLTAIAGDQVFQGSHLGRPAHYFAMTEVIGSPEMSGEELLDSGPRNTFELRWATPDEFDALNLRPPEIRPLLAALLTAAHGRQPFCEPLPGHATMSSRGGESKPGDGLGDGAAVLGLG